MSQLSKKAAAHPARSCSRAPVALPGLSGIALKAAKVLRDGDQIVHLTWSGAAGTNVDIYRNGAYRISTRNDGFARSYPQRAGQYTFKVCEAGKARCSNSASVTIR